MSTRQVVIVSASVVAALLVALIITVIILITTVNGQAEEAAYRACMERLDPGFNAETGIDDYARGLADNAAFCER